MVVASLVLGIVGTVFGVAGLVLGIVALGRVHAAHGEVHMLQEEVESLTNRLITAVADAAVAHAQAEDATIFVSDDDAVDAVDAEEPDEAPGVDEVPPRAEGLSGENASE